MSAEKLDVPFHVTVGQTPLLELRPGAIIPVTDSVWFYRKELSVFKLVRHMAIGKATLGTLYANATPIAFTLEDDNRLARGEEKVQGSTAIPAGRFRLVLAPSARFGRPMPRILDVPGFEGILIHPGNTEADTSGCVLVGRKLVLEGGTASTEMSRVSLADVVRELRAVGGSSWIEIVNAEPRHEAVA